VDLWLFQLLFTSIWKKICCTSHHICSLKGRKESSSLPQKAENVQLLIFFFQMLAPNRDAMRETTTAKTLYRSDSPVIRNPGNMSELDSLLQDLSSNSKFSQQHYQNHQPLPHSPHSKGKGNSSGIHWISSLYLINYLDLWVNQFLLKKNSFSVFNKIKIKKKLLFLIGIWRIHS